MKGSADNSISSGEEEINYQVLIDDLLYPAMLKALNQAKRDFNKAVATNDHALIQVYFSNMRSGRLLQLDPSTSLLAIQMPSSLMENHQGIAMVWNQEYSLSIEWLKLYERTFIVPQDIRDWIKRRIEKCKRHMG